MKLRVGSKMLGGYLTVIALMGSAIVLGVSDMKDQAARYQDLTGRVMVLQVDAPDLLARIEAEARAVNAYLVDPDPLYKQQFLEAKEKADRDLADLHDGIESNESKQILVEVEQANATFGELAQSILDKASYTKEEAKQLTVRMRGPRLLLNEAVDRLVAYEAGMVARTEMELEAAGRSATTRNAGMAALAALVGLVIALWQSRTISRTVGGLASAAQRIAHGDLLVEDQRVRSQDELGDMARDFNLMVASLRTLLGQVSSS